ncbi:MAG: DMT family transporter [Clostridia bacterium]|nr:DMT family transporter [Clostridia bacterium]
MSIENRSVVTVGLALLSMVFWGSIFSFIKLGYKAFGINTEKPADILMFAAIRFLVCGILVCAFCFLNRKKYTMPTKKDILNISVMGFFQIFLHYTCTYIGLSLTASSKTALLKQLGTLLYVSLAFLFFKDEKFSIFKIIGVILGFGGIIAMNAKGGAITFARGDILIIAASFCTVISAIMSKKFVRHVSPVLVTGMSQLFGGVLLLAVSLVLGGAFPAFNLKAAAVLAYICLASIAGYTLWYYVIGRIELSALFIIKFAEPVFACIFAALILGENILRIQYLAGFLLISLGIVLGGRKQQESKAAEKTE